MMPSTDNNQITVSANFDSGITLDNAAEKTKQIESVLSKYQEVTGCVFYSNKEQCNN